MRCEVLPPRSRAGVVLVVWLLAGGLTRGDDAEVLLLGKASFPGTARDRSGLKDTLEGGFPHDRLNFGSGIAWTGKGNRYLLLPDRGPADGATRFFARFHTFDIEIDAGKEPVVRPVLRATTLLKNRAGKNLMGWFGAFDPVRPDDDLRFDPEGLRVGREGQLFVAEEYGPALVEFNAQGEWQRRFTIPRKLRIARPSANPEEEQKHNRTGRAPNGGFEGLAISPDGGKLYAMLEKPLLQDRDKRDLRIVEFTRAGAPAREFVYRMASDLHRVSELLAVDERRFLVLERDNLGGTMARYRKVVLINLEGATDVAGLEGLTEAAGAKVKPVVRKDFLDLLAPAHRLAGASMPLKLEGMAFGPALADGRLVLLITSDNDFKAEEPNWIYAFAIAPRALPGFRPQAFDRP